MTPHAPDPAHPVDPAGSADEPRTGSAEHFERENLSPAMLRNYDREDGAWREVRTLNRAPVPEWRLAFLSWLALPVYAAQGMWVRSRVLRLPPAPGAIEGLLGAASHDEADIRLLVMGDSTSASVGLEHTDDSLAAQLAGQLHERTGRPVSWHSSGHNSAISQELRDIVVPLLERHDYTHILLTVGTNDTKNLHSVGRFKKAFGGLLYALHAKWPRARVYWSEAVDPRDVPGLPSPLDNIMRWRRDLINAKAQELCFERGATSVRPIPNVMPAGFCVDGFHASVEGLMHWAEGVADAIVSDLELETKGHTTKDGGDLRQAAE